jgi:hypothetical protein
MTREDMLVDMLKQADLEIKVLQERIAFLSKEVEAHRQLLNALGPLAFSGTH